MKWIKVSCGEIGSTTVLMDVSRVMLLKLLVQHGVCDTACARDLSSVVV